MTQETLIELQTNIRGKVYHDDTMRHLYATDASAYRELPLAVVIPKCKEDIRKLILFASKNNIPIIPRAAGTSLAGQVVGSGIVVDISEHFGKIIEINPHERYVIVEPGIIRDDLNKALEDYHLFFGPETSTSNRCMIGGMVGNNSCGSRSLIYGSTRDHIRSMKVLLSDGNEVEFKALSKQCFEKKVQGVNTASQLEVDIYNQAYKLFSSNDNRSEILDQFPKKSIPRRNTGYALDLLAQSNSFSIDTPDFNFCNILAGSEGTLAFTTQIKLNLVPRPSAHKALICMHFNSVQEALESNIKVLEYKPTASELIDHYILDCTKLNKEQRENRFFIQGEPQAILIVEFVEQYNEVLQKKIEDCVSEFKKQGWGFHHPVVQGKAINRVWDLRAAGLGLLSNIAGDAKPVAVIEDTAVDVNDLPSFIKDFNQILNKRNLHCVHYAHAATGELHLRPIINLKTQEGNSLYKLIAKDISRLVKQYKGSLSGEHGDGRLRGEFLPYMIGSKNYQHCIDLKNTWDPKGIFNPGKIVNTPSMNSSLRYMPDYKTKEFSTILDFSQDLGMQRAVEKCNGSGDCRKPAMAEGVMCPSYRITAQEKHSTRARANILRELFSSQALSDVFTSGSAKEVLDLCVSCKACKSECPSNVDMAKIKAEFDYQLQKRQGISLRTRLFAMTSILNKYASVWPGLYNFIVTNTITSSILKHMMGIAKQRSLPVLSLQTLNNWYINYQQKGSFRSSVYLFNDEFTNYHHYTIGVKCIKLLNSLGYKVIIPQHLDSGRAFISKGLLEQAKVLANYNIQALSSKVSETCPIIGLEPSAILSFRDEYVDLADDKLKARRLAKYSFTIEEFFARQIDAGQISSAHFTSQEKQIRVHGHCHQKALSSLTPSKKMLSLPSHYHVKMIPSGCCGMAGSFGFEKEHYSYAMQMAELKLLPYIRSEEIDTVIVASGTSCRHQIKDGTQKETFHPVEVLYDALA